MQLSGVFIHPHSKVLKLFLRQSGEVRTFGEETSDESVSVFITTALRGTIRMGIEKLRSSKIFSSAQFDNAVCIEEFGTIITGNEFE